jgi:hypothetical protein
MSQLNNFAQIRASESVTLVVPFIGIPKARLFFVSQEPTNRIATGSKRLATGAGATGSSQSGKAHRGERRHSGGARRPEAAGNAAEGGGAQRRDGH